MKKVKWWIDVSEGEKEFTTYDDKTEFEIDEMVQEKALKSISWDWEVAEE